MPEESKQITNSKTLVINAEDFDFEAIEQANGMATVVKFKLENPSVTTGDVLLILAGDEIQFHGFIGNIDGGYAMAIDRNGSALPASVH
jgi:hypothetical protein